MLKVLVDPVVFENPRQRGIQRVFREVWQRMPNVQLRGWMAGGTKASIPSNLDLKQGARWQRFNRCGHLNHLRRSGQFDLFHSTFYTSLGGSSLPEVVTVFDLIVHRYPELFRFLDRRQIGNVERCARNATRIIAISQATADDLVHFVPETKSRIKVIHLGGCHLAAQAQPQQHTQHQSAGKPYVVYVGTRLPYKNFPVVLEAMRETVWPRDVDLAIVGAPWTDAERQQLIDRGLVERVHHRGNVSDRALQELLQDSLGLVSTSFMEGFGLPVIEAQALRVPVLCSDIPVYREIADETALFFDPRDPAALAGELVKLLDPAVRDRLICSGERNAERYSWDRCARETFEVYEEAAALGNRQVD